MGRVSRQGLEGLHIWNKHNAKEDKETCRWTPIWHAKEQHIYQVHRCE